METVVLFWTRLMDDFSIKKYSYKYHYCPKSSSDSWPHINQTQFISLFWYSYDLMYLNWSPQYLAHRQSIISYMNRGQTVGPREVGHSLSGNRGSKGNRVQTWPYNGIISNFIWFIINKHTCPWSRRVNWKVRTPTSFLNSPVPIVPK